MLNRDVDSVDPAIDSEETIEDPALVWWLVKMAAENRPLYRRIRAIAWDLVVERSHYSGIPKNPS